MKTFSYLTLDIVGICNAKCPYCSTGSRNITPGSIMSPDLFRNTLNKLLSKGTIDSNTILYLYNWGEPFLHPDLKSIIKILIELNLKYIFSTNASNIPEINEEFFNNNLLGIRFSLPGFSQKSYDRIHKLNFEEVKKNITYIVESSKKYNYNGIFAIAYHVYQFNLFEIVHCQDFAAKLQIGMIPYAAYLNDYWLLRGYLDNSLPYQTLKKISEDLFATFIKDKIAEMPEKYHCPQFDILTVDENANLLTCCLLPRNHPDYSCGNIIEDNLETIMDKKYSQPECKKCIESGMSYYVHNVAKIYPEELSGVPVNDNKYPFI